MPIGYKVLAAPNGSAIRKAREMLGLSQDALVEASRNKISKVSTFALETLRRAERGESISQEKLTEIAKCLNVSIEDITSKAEISESVIDLFPLEIPQEVFANALADVLGIKHKLKIFSFYEETGDFDVNRSRLIIEDGIGIRFRYRDVEGAQRKILAEYAKPFIDRGFIDTCWVVEGFKKRWAKGEGKIPKHSNIVCILEGMSSSLGDISSEKLVDSLMRYAFDLPDDADRTFLNCMPEPSPTIKLIKELVRRDAWRELESGFAEIALLNRGIIIHWTARIIEQRHSIQDKTMLQLIEDARPEGDPLRTWAEKLVENWIKL